jgi:hypothetical protein
MKKHLYLVLFIVFNLIGFPLCSMAQSNLIDVVYLKNGSIIKGIIVEQVPGHAVKLQTADGSLFVFESSEITKMTREPQTTTNATPSAQPQSPSTSPSTALAPKDVDDWGRTYQQNMELAQQKKSASIGLLSAGSALVAGGTFLLVLSGDKSRLDTDRNGYFVGGIIAAVAGVPLLGIGGGLWSAQLKYRKRAENMGGGSAFLRPTLIDTQEFSGVYVRSGSAIGLQLTYRF